MSIRWFAAALLITGAALAADLYVYVYVADGFECYPECGALAYLTGYAIWVLAVATLIVPFLAGAYGRSRGRRRQGR